jgi:hypothetical protein
VLRPGEPWASGVIPSRLELIRPGSASPARIIKGMASESSPFDSGRQRWAQQDCLEGELQSGPNCGCCHRVSDCSAQGGVACNGIPEGEMLGARASAPSAVDRTAGADGDGTLPRLTLQKAKTSDGVIAWQRQAAMGPRSSTVPVWLVWEAYSGA